MPIPGSSFSWQDAVAAFGIVSVVAFLVTWFVTDLGHVPRTLYVGILAAITFVLATGYLAWSGTSIGDLVATDWAWGAVGGTAAAAVVGQLVRRLPRRSRPSGAGLAGRLLWEGVVYGTAEAILLATLPVLAVWQAADMLGWTDSGLVRVAAGALAILGALFVIAVHHLGYREFRGKGGRKMLAGALTACGIQALAFLITGNALAPILAHIVLHIQLTLRGDEMPPSSDFGVESPRLGRMQTPVATPRRTEVVG